MGPSRGLAGPPRAATTKTEHRTLADGLGFTDDGFRRAEDSVTFDHLLAGLEERERTVLHLRFREDLTQAEIGDRVGISQMHVSRLIRQAIDHLRASIPQAG